MGNGRDDNTKVSRGRSAAGAPADPARPARFEEGLARLADIVGRLEGGQLGLAESIAAYESGVAIVRVLQGELADVEQRVRMLTVPPSDEGGAAEVEADPARAGSRRGTPKGPRAMPGGEGSKSSTGGPGRPPAVRGGRLPGMDDAENDV